MKRTGLSTTRFGLATLALSTFIWAAPAGAQSQSTIPQNRDSDVTQLQLSDMNSFLDSHPEIGEQVRKDPTLLENQNFLQSHPALQQFLSTHQRIAQEIRENPQAFMRADDRFDARQDRQGLHSQLVDLDEFLDKHPEVAEQLRKNPSLINDNKWVASHPAFQQFLAEHQQLQNEFRENPSVFMAEEQRYDRREGTRQGMGDRDVNRTELANMDRFMDSHPEIAEQLRKNPALVDDKRFVSSHPELQQFLEQHPGVREEYKENPTAFMAQEQRYDRREDSNFGRDRDVTNGELSSFHSFLDNHSSISAELSKNPSLAKNQEYLENHPALQSYLQSHTQVREELNENPDSFFKSAQTFDSRTAVKGTAKLPTDPKLK